MKPQVARALYWMVIGFGAVTLVSAVANIVGAVLLISPVEEDALGVTRTEVIRWFSCAAAAGVVLISYGVYLLNRKR
jgi:hypothetical protein